MENKTPAKSIDEKGEVIGEKISFPPNGSED